MSASSDPVSQPTAIEAASAFFVRAFEPEHRLDPYALYAEERAAHPLVDTGMHMWIAFLHDDCWATVRSPSASSDERRGTLFRLEAQTDPRLAAMFDRRPSLIFQDPPDHTRVRGLVSRAFTPARIEQLRARIEELTDELVDGLAERLDSADTSVDIIDALAYPLPLTVICELLGIPLADHELFKAWSKSLIRSVDPSVLRTDEENAAIEVATAELDDYCLALLEERRRAPRDDLLSALVTAQDGDDELESSEIVGLASLLLVAGHETTVNLVGNGLLALLANPDELRRWISEPGLDANAVDELLRYDPPVQMVQRIVTGPLVLSDTAIPEGDQVIVIIGAANRDPEVFAEPDRLDLGRANANRHLAFGGGIHHCLGAALARTEGSVVLSRLIRRFPDIALAGAPTLRPTFTLRGYASVPVALDGAS